MKKNKSINELVLNTNPKAGVSEAIKTIRTNLHFTNIDDRTKSLLVTSSIPGEGKSFVSANLAIAFAQTGANVLLVDCDLRRGRQHKMFNIRYSVGLSDLLLDDIDNKYKMYIKKTEIENLSILPRGIVPPNPSEILNSDKNKRLVEILERNYDIVIFDGPPIVGIADSVIMANVVDEIVIVSCHKLTKIEDIQNTVKALQPFKHKIAGVILNKAQLQNKSSYYYY